MNVFRALIYCLLLIFRITEAGWKLSRPSEQIGRYTMLSVGHHQSSRAGSERYIALFCCYNIDSF